MSAYIIDKEKRKLKLIHKSEFGCRVCEICYSVARNVAGGNEMIEAELVVVVEEGGRGNATVEDREGSRWKPVWIFVLICYVSLFFMYILHSV